MSFFFNKTLLIYNQKVVLTQVTILYKLLLFVKHIQYMSLEKKYALHL